MNKEKVIDFFKTVGIRLFLFFVFAIAIPLLLVWCTLVINYTFPEAFKDLFATLFPIAGACLLLGMKDLTKSLKIFSSVCLLIMLYYLSISPGLNRNWTDDVAILPEVDFKDNMITIKNFRNFSYSDKNNYTKNYEERRYNLDELEGSDFIISYWDNYRSIGHTFVSFRFKNRPPLCISVEVRKEKGEKYHPVKGLFKQYELIYVIGDERDLISLRTNHRAEETFIYPLNIDKKQSETFLLSLLQGAQKIREVPLFYHSVNRNCTTTLVSHINTVPEFKVKVSLDLLMNGLSDYAVYKMKGVDNDLPFAVLKRCCYISKLAKTLPLDENYSKNLRQTIKQKINFELKQTH